MENPIAEEKVGNFKIEIFQEEDSVSPREDDSLFTMVCWHRNYNLGDERPRCTPIEWSKEFAYEVDDTVDNRIDWWENEGYRRLRLQHSAREALEVSVDKIRKIIWKTINEHVIILPLYLYDHGGITIRTEDFNDRWDSGQVGWIYVTKEKIRKEYKWKHITKKRIEKIKEYLRLDVEIYDRYLRNDVYGYVITEHDVCKHCGKVLETHVDSCWGFFEEPADLIKMVKTEVFPCESELDGTCSRFKVLQNALVGEVAARRVDKLAAHLDKKLEGENRG